MTKDRSNREKSRSLRTLLGVSLGIHLFFFFAGFLILADVAINPDPSPPMEISLLPPVLSPMVVEKRLAKPKSPAEEKPLPPEAKQELPREEPFLKTVVEPEHPLPLQAAMKPVQLADPQPLPVQRDEEVSLPSPSEVFSSPTPSAKQEPVRVASADPVFQESTTIVLPMAASTAPPTAPPSPPLPELSVSLPAPPRADERIIFARPRYGENPKPVYPAEARRKGYQGEVLLRAEVLSTGRVGEVELKKSSGHEILDRSALTAVKQWKFIPAREGEKTVAVWVTIPVKFQLQ